MTEREMHRDLTEMVIGWRRQIMMLLDIGAPGTHERGKVLDECADEVAKVLVTYPQEGGVRRDGEVQ